MTRAESAPSDKDKKTGVDYIRHSKAGYRTYARDLKSDNPQKPFDHTDQVTPDLPEAGVELARQKADEYFSQLDPEVEDLFFVSSNEARAIETANIYRQVAHEKGFETVRPENVRSEYAEEVGEGEIRVVNQLSINSDNPFIDGVFTPSGISMDINWDAIPEDVRERYDEARTIISADDQGSWGANFAKHSEAIKAIIPEITTARELFESKFRNLMKLARFAHKKEGELATDSKRIRVLAFGHENAMVSALEHYFSGEGLGNCEVARFNVDDDNVIAEYRGDKQDIDV